MNSSLIAKSLIGLAVAGAATGGVVFATWPSKEKEKVSLEADKMAERNSKINSGFKSLESLFSKYKGNDTATKKLSSIVHQREGVEFVFAIGENNLFLDDGPAKAAMSAWCGDKNWVSSNSDEYEKELAGKRKEICSFAEINW